MIVVARQVMRSADNASAPVLTSAQQDYAAMSRTQFHLLILRKIL